MYRKFPCFDTSDNFRPISSLERAGKIQRVDSSKASNSQYPDSGTNTILSSIHAATITSIRLSCFYTILIVFVCCFLLYFCFINCHFLLLSSLLFLFVILYFLLLCLIIFDLFLVISYFVDVLFFLLSIFLNFFNRNTP